MQPRLHDSRGAYGLLCREPLGTTNATPELLDSVLRRAAAVADCVEILECRLTDAQLPESARDDG